MNPNGLAGARIGTTRQGIDNAPPQVAAAFDAAVAAIQAAGATVVDLDAAGFSFTPADGEFLVLLFDFKLDVQKYFATRVGVPMANKTLADAIAFNDANAATEMPFFFQEIFELAEAMDTSSPNAPQPIFGGLTYNQALQLDHNAGVKPRRGAQPVPARRDCGADRQPGLDYRSDPLRPLPLRQLGPGGRARLSHRPSPLGQRARDAGGHQLLRDGVQ